MTAPLRIGLLGASRIAQEAVTDASRETGDIRAAVAARDPERARVYAAEHGYDRVHEGYDALISDDTLDVIYLGLPNAMHAEWTVRALEAGRNVLVEKPFASNLTEFDAVAARMEHAAGWAWEAFHYADHPLMRRLLEIVTSGEIGEVREVQVAMCMPPPPETDPRWSFDLAGGALMDVGCYAINGLLLLAEATGRSLDLSAVEVDHSALDSRIDATMRARFDLGGAAVTMRTSMVNPIWDFSLSIVGSTGGVHAPNFVKPQEDDRLLVHAGGAAREEHLGTRSTYAYQLERIREAVRGGERSREELDRSRRTMELIDAVYTAGGLRSGRRVSPAERSRWPRERRAAPVAPVRVQPEPKPRTPGAPRAAYPSEDPRAAYPSESPRVACTSGG